MSKIIKNIFAAIFLFFLFMACSNQDDTSKFEEQEEQNQEELVIESYSPDRAYSGDEVEIIANNIDVNLEYTISFNGSEAENVTISETKIVAVVPDSATSGEITISYGNISTPVGNIEIVEELDNLYAFFRIEGADCAIGINSLDENSGNILNKVDSIIPFDCYENIDSNFYRNGNVFIQEYEDYFGQGLPPGRRARVKDLDTGSSYSWTLEYDQDSSKTFLTAESDSIYYIHNNYIDTDEFYELRKANLDGSNKETLYSFSGPIDAFGGGFLNSKELVFFAKDETNTKYYYKFNLTTNNLVRLPIQDYFSQIYFTTNGRIFAFQAPNVVEIDNSTGNVANTIASINSSVLKLTYSLSTNRVFALGNNQGEQTLFKIDLADGSVKNVVIDQQSEYPSLYGIYFND